MKHCLKLIIVLFLSSTTYSVNSQTKKPVAAPAKKPVAAPVKKPTTAPTFQYEYFVDNRDGKNYKAIKIGNQTWMAENLAYLPKLNYYGNSDRGDDYTPLYQVYRNDQDGTPEDKIDIEARSEDLQIVKTSDSYKTYGVLYNYAAAKKGCPAGWHLPSDKEWQELELFLGMSEQQINNFNTWRASGFVGKKLKSRKGWESGNGIDQVGFNALPAGERDENYFDGRGDETIFWSSSSSGAMQCAGSRRLIGNTDEIYRGCTDWWYSISVRCVKNQ